MWYGYGMALGVDIALLQNLFVRGEYEFTQLHANNDIKFNLSTIRGGVGSRNRHFLQPSTKSVFFVAN